MIQYALGFALGAFLVPVPFIFAYRAIRDRRDHWLNKYYEMARDRDVRAKEASTYYGELSELNAIIAELEDDARTARNMETSLQLYITQLEDQLQETQPLKPKKAPRKRKSKS